MADVHVRSAREMEVRQQARKATSEARQAATSPWAARFARFGFAAKGIVYILMGFLALRAAIGAGGRITDIKGALFALYGGTLGRALLLVVGVGLAGYAFWCLARALLNADHHEHNMKGAATRVGYGAIGLGYVGLALTALQLVFGWGNGGKSSDASAQDWTARFLSLPFGVPLVVLVGVVLLGVAVAVAYSAAKRDFEHYLQRGEMGSVEPIVRWLGRIGHGALAVITLIIGLFLIVAALHHDPHEAKGLGGALVQLTQEPFGPLLLGLVALGLLAFGLFSLAEARYHRISAW
jgi:hypothetical protein